MISLSRKPLPLVAAAALACGLQLLATAARAHIELQLPMNRYSNIKMGENKACPCGSGTTSRRCNDPAEFSDTDRSLDRITTFAPGDTITVRFDEYVGHDGRYRIAFDPDGAELEDFNQHILLDEPDPRGSTGNIGEGSVWEFQVTLPDMTCDNCTLQLIQVMDGNTTDRVLDPSTRGGTYFQCADIILAEGTPVGGIPPASPGEHLAERRRPERAPSTLGQPAQPEDTAEAPESAVGTAMMAVGDALPGNGSTPPAEREDSTPGGSSTESGACALAPGRSQRSLSGLCLLALTGSALSGRRRRR